MNFENKPLLFPLTNEVQQIGVGKCMKYRPPTDKNQRLTMTSGHSQQHNSRYLHFNRPMLEKLTTESLQMLQDY